MDETIKKLDKELIGKKVICAHTLNTQFKKGNIYTVTKTREDYDYVFIMFKELPSETGYAFKQHNEYQGKTIFELYINPIDDILQELELKEKEYESLS